MSDLTKPDIPWYRRTVRWGQTNLTETDPAVCDLGWWREYWRRTRVQGVIVNAGGIVAYYPSAFKLQRRAEELGNRDLFGEFLTAARQDGLAVLARMDINRTARDFFEAHPDWFVKDAAGSPVKAGEQYFTCINSGYYKEYIPQVLREIITLYHPDGFTDNSWTGVPRSVICRCDNCKRKFMEECGLELPESADWDDPAYDAWIKWSYKCRVENWDLFNRIAQEYGGKDCLWLGMVSADPIRASSVFCDLLQVAERSEIIMCDQQSRSPLYGFEQNSLNGSLLHGLMGWDKVIPESMANYISGIRVFRRGSNPPRDTQLWMIDGIAGGISPWYHHIGAVQEDRRQFENAYPVMQWHERNEKYLYDRIPVANIGLVWSRDNTDFYGRDHSQEKVALPWHGFAHALTRARLPFIPVNADHILREAENIQVLILPDLAVMNEKQLQEVADFVESGGSLVLTGASATLDEWGRERASFPFEALIGIKHMETVFGADENQSSDWDKHNAHNYFRLPCERHPLLKGFENTDILPFGGQLKRVCAEGFMKTVATYIPSFPIYPPELSWMREPLTDIPAVLAGEYPSGGRIVYFAGDVDRCYGRSHLPDHGELLANAVRWAAHEEFPVKVEGPGYLDCRLYRGSGRLILHIVNLSGCNQYPGYVEEFLPVGPISVSVRHGSHIPQRALLRVYGGEAKPEVSGEWATVRIDRITDHELIVFE